MISTASSGETYTAQPGSRLFFATWDVATADLPPPTGQPALTAGDRGLNMPRRQQTRTAALTAAIKAERVVDERDTPPF